MILIYYLAIIYKGVGQVSRSDQIRENYIKILEMRVKKGERELKRCQDSNRQLVQEIENLKKLLEQKENENIQVNRTEEEQLAIELYKNTGDELKLLSKQLIELNDALSKLITVEISPAENDTNTSNNKKSAETKIIEQTNELTEMKQQLSELQELMKANQQDSVSIPLSHQSLYPLNQNKTNYTFRELQSASTIRSIASKNTGRNSSLLPQMPPSFSMIGSSHNIEKGMNPEPAIENQAEINTKPFDQTIQPNEEKEKKFVSAFSFFKRKG